MSNEPKYQRGDVFQVVSFNETGFGALVYADDVLEWGIEARVPVVRHGRPIEYRGLTLQWSQVEYVGRPPTLIPEF